MTKYVLCRHALGQPGQVGITVAEFNSLKADLKTLVELSDVEEKFSAFMDNYFELERSLLEETLRAMIYSEHGPDRLMGPKHTISRRIINLLTAIRLYLDTYPHHLNRFLPAGDALEQVKAAPSRAYDRSLSYRIMETLRNYAQHEDLPVHGWEVNQYWDDSTEPSLMKAQVNPSLDVAVLSEAEKFKKTVLKELTGKTVALKPLIREYIEQLGLVHEEFREATKSLREYSTNMIKDAVARFVAQYPGSDISVVALPVNEEGYKAGEPVYLSAIVMKYLPHLQSRIGSLVNYARRRAEY